MKREQLLTILLAPHVSEKTQLLEAGQYVFKVKPQATKLDIKQAVEEQFQVKVQAVRVCNIQGKSTRTKQIKGRRSDWKKAYVTLEAGQEIEAFKGD